MLEYLLDLAKEGLFIITPGSENCKNCRFETACRKAHGAALARSKNSAAAKKLKDYHAT
jgi:hypothetical protein